jgi:ABC-type transport system involved in cytochrome bd biosynthesis fused ATPase/permease subunit
LLIFAKWSFPWQGRIQIGGKPLNCVDLEAHVSIQSQAAELFDGDILSNVKLASPNLTVEQVEECCKKACLLGMPESSWLFPKGVYTQCGPEGKCLSVGTHCYVFVFLCSGASQQGTFVVIQGTFVMIQGTFVVIQGTFVMIQGTFVVI